MFAGIFIVLNGEGQAKRQGSIDQSPFEQAAKQIDDAATPIVDYDGRDGVDRVNKTARKLKNARYDHGVLPSNPGDIGEIRSEPERSSSFSDLPAAQSQVIAEAIVGNSRAFLSDDKTAVYSEFAIILDKIVKSADGLLVNPGDTIFAERYGGKVRYPSGKMIRYRVEGEGVPIVGKRYIVFLAKADEDTYNLLTAYEIKGNKIFPIDGSRNSIFAKHNGKDLDTFMREVGTVSSH